MNPAEHTFTATEHPEFSPATGPDDHLDLFERGFLEVGHLSHRLREF